jgi:hypothetical protein
VNGETLIAAFAAYDFDIHFDFLAKQLASDWLIAFCIPVIPLALHWADMPKVYEHLDKATLCVHRVIDIGPDDPRYSSAVAVRVCAAGSWPSLVWSCRMPRERRQSVADLMAAMDMTWDKAAESVDHIASISVWLRESDDRTMGAHYQSANTFIYCIRCGYILMASDARVSDAEIMQGLPSIDEIQTLTPTFPDGCGNFSHSAHLFLNAFLSCAAVCDQLGRHAEALAYATAGLLPDFAKAGTTLNDTRILLQTAQARALARLGRVSNAGLVFEAAAEEAHRHGFWLYEAFCLRDLKIFVLDEMGHGSHASRRVGAALRLLNGPAEMLTPLLDGLDAAELIALPPPDVSYRIVYDTGEQGPAEDDDSEMRAELEALGVMALHKRAVSQGVNVMTELKDAMASGAPKAALVELLLALPHPQ